MLNPKFSGYKDLDRAIRSLARYIKDKYYGPDVKKVMIVEANATEAWKNTPDGNFMLVPDTYTYWRLDKIDKDKPEVLEEFLKGKIKHTELINQ